MQAKFFNTMPQWGGKHYERAATYAWCKDLYSRKRGPYRAIGSNQYIRYDAPTDAYQIWYGKPHEPTDVLTHRVYCKPVVAVHTDDTIEVLHVGGQGENMLLSGVVGRTVYRKSDVRSSHVYWVSLGTTWDPVNQVRITPPTAPAHVGMKFKAGQILTEAPAITRRTVNTTTAKPVRQMLADWKKRLEIVVMLRSEDYKDINRHEWQVRQSARNYVPDVSDTFDGEVAHMMLLKARLSTDATRWGHDTVTGTYKTIPVPDFEGRLIKRAIELFRDPVYQFHGVYEWKEAA